MLDIEIGWIGRNSSRSGNYKHINHCGMGNHTWRILVNTFTTLYDLGNTRQKKSNNVNEALEKSNGEKTAGLSKTRMNGEHLWQVAWLEHVQQYQHASRE